MIGLVTNCFVIVNPVKERFGIQLTSVDHYSSAKLPVDCHLVSRCQDHLYKVGCLINTVYDTTCVNTHMTAAAAML